MKKITLILAFFGAMLWSYSGMSQSYFDDGLGKDFHKGRRDALRQQMPANSAAIFFSNPVRNRSNDVDYIYHQDPDFFYLTGLREPNSVLLIFSEPQMIDGKSVDEVIFVQPRDPNAEMWNGIRLGVDGAKDILGFEHAYLNAEFAGFPFDYTKLDKLMTLGFATDARDSNSKADLVDLIKQFKENAQFPEGFTDQSLKLYELIRTTDQESSANVATVVGRYIRMYPELAEDQLLLEYQKTSTPSEREAIKSKVPKINFDLSSLALVMNSLREVKTTEELKMLRKAISISAVGQVEVMKAMKPGMNEREIQGIHEFVYKRYDAEDIGYPSIVGAGHNGCILHYIDNNKRSFGSELVLMDLGAQYRGYTADVTRTIPSKGKFSAEQKAIYEIVLKAQDEAMAAIKAGLPFGEINKISQRVINEGLVELGIIKRGQRHRYFPHGTSHYLGLDVHDRGNYGPLKENMVITVEPGIYIPEGSDCDPKWWGIAVRIEDDVLITKDGCENLSGLAPRTVKDIEAMMAKKSILEDWVLPKLD
ncbi:aminopeptidase P family protein [Penaeicola halotolerans]|uniref:aminopeptidase P family protein n=1 Tax=Penaeicola halotolerans TaxID=2793196 RepID=UPI001CF82E53|nr:aminopeptidase P N-terminal domain-containing protein [Penaeicola halotolerans]